MKHEIKYKVDLIDAEEGGYVISIPFLKLYTQGDDLLEAFSMLLDAFLVAAKEFCTEEEFSALEIRFHHNKYSFKHDFYFTCNNENIIKKLVKCQKNKLA